jgi:hypothetical protein
MYPTFKFSLVRTQDLRPRRRITNLPGGGNDLHSSSIKRERLFLRVLIIGTSSQQLMAAFGLGVFGVF